jgi:hypothetical protein
MGIRLLSLILAMTVLVLGTGGAAADTQVAKKKKARKPSSDQAISMGKNGIPLLPDGTPDYSKYPNPFVVKKWTFEIEGAMGSNAQGDGYQEFGLGANAYFYNWLAWRNIAFFRPPTQNNGSPIYGIDMTERMSYEFSRSNGLAVFASPGYRLAGGGMAAPLAEAGFTVRIAGLTLGGGVRGLMRSWVETAASNETQFFINLSTGSHP